MLLHINVVFICTMEFTKKDILGLAWFNSTLAMWQIPVEILNVFLRNIPRLSSSHYMSLRPLRLLLLWYLRMMSWILGLCSKMLWHVSFASFTLKIGHKSILNLIKEVGDQMMIITTILMILKQKIKMMLETMIIVMILRTLIMTKIMTRTMTMMMRMMTLMMTMMMTMMETM